MWPHFGHVRVPYSRMSFDQQYGHRRGRGIRADYHSYDPNDLHSHITARRRLGFQ